MVKTAGRALRLIVMTAAAAGSLAFATAGYAGAATSIRPAAPVNQARACIVTAARVTGHGQVRVISPATAECVTASGGHNVEAIGAKTKLINVGYGCQFKDFSKKGTCWHFAVPKPGCQAGSAWIWKKLGVMKNKMESWKAIRTCHSGQIFSKANLKGRSVLCSAQCRSLGSLNDHDVSLEEGFGKTP
jgi:hypothetical protein